MDQDEMKQGLRNLDRRVEGIEQILLALATKDGLQAAIDRAVEPLATTAEVQDAKTALRAAIDESEHRCARISMSSLRVSATMSS